MPWFPPGRRADGLRVASVTGLEFSPTPLTYATASGEGSSVVWLAWFRRMSTTERVVVLLIAFALTLGAIELTRRELALHRRSAESWWRVDAAAAGALFTALAALGAWLSLAINRAPT